MRLKLRKCPYCGEPDMVRTHRKSLLEHVFSGFALYPYTCRSCDGRSFLPHWSQVRIIACAAVLVLGLLGAVITSHHRLERMRHPGAVEPTASNTKAGTLSAEAAAPGSRPLPMEEDPGPVLTVDLSSVMTNEDIVRFSRAGMSSRLVIQLIDHRPHRFRLDVRSLLDLKAAGTPEEVIAAMLDASVGTPASPGSAISAERVYRTRATQ